RDQDAIARREQRVALAGALHVAVQSALEPGGVGHPGFVLDLGAAVDHGRRPDLGRERPAPVASGCSPAVGPSGALDHGRPGHRMAFTTADGLTTFYPLTESVLPS